MRDAGLEGLETARLKLRRFTWDDLPLLRRLNSDPEVMRYISGVETPEQTENILRERILAYYERHPGFGSWATLRKDTGECVGMHLLNDIRGTAHIQVGYRLFPAHWGRGYATEMALALVRYGFVDRELEQITAITDLGNRASQHTLLKCGLHRGDDRHFDPALFGPEPLAWFERDRADWLAERGD